MLEVASHVLDKFLRDLLISYCEEARGFTSQLAQGVVKLFASLIKELYVSRVLEASLLLEVDLNQFTILRKIYSKGILG
jgi:hypothetical protein